MAAVDEDPGAGCPLERLLRLLGTQWTPHLLWVLRHDGPLRFGALRRRLGGISSKVLTERLRMLEAEGIVYRDAAPTVPPRVTYGLTPRGEALGDVLGGLDRVAHAPPEPGETRAARAG